MISVIISAISCHHIITLYTVLCELARLSVSLTQDLHNQIFGNWFDAIEVNYATFRNDSIRQYGTCICKWSQDRVEISIFFDTIHLTG